MSEHSPQTDPETRRAERAANEDVEDLLDDAPLPSDDGPRQTDGMPVEDPLDEDAWPREQEDDDA